jgi:hypothetical protein
MVVAGLHAILAVRPARRILWATIKRLGFAQNIERDYPGTTKYPWPHEYYDRTEGNKYYSKWFDAPDILTPNIIGMMILASRARWLYWFLPLAYAWHWLAMLGSKYSKHYEENQMLAECFVYGTLARYARIKPRWERVSLKYWAERKEVEYHYFWKELVK